MIVSKGFTLSYTPLTVTATITVDNTVSDNQVYNSFVNEYIPDYTVVPLILKPNVSIIDKDGVLSDGNVNASLANITWTEVIGTTSTVITSSTDGYELVSSGVGNGTLRVKKNLSPDTTATLKFYAEYTDSRTGQVYKINASYLLKCDSSSKGVPELELDIDPAHFYNPLRDTESIKVSAQLYVDGGICPASYRAFTWDISRDGKTFSTIGSSKLHYYISVSSDKTYCTVNQNLMGEKFILRCRAQYDEDGTPSNDTLSDASPCKMITFTRLIPKYDVDIVGTSNIPAGVSSIKVDLNVRDAKNVITDYQKVFQPVWYGNEQNSSYSATPTTVRGYGSPCTLSTSFVNKTYGSVIGCDLVDRGPMAALLDDSGNIITDDSGSIIVIN
jgi:hypothetical protein